MRVKMWSRPLLSAGLLLLGMYAPPALAADEGTQVLVTLPADSGELPEHEKLVQAVKAAGGEHQVKVMHKKSAEQHVITMQVWGNTIPAADIPRTLREGFPVLAKADIQVSALDASQRPNFEELEREGLRSTDGKKVKRIIKKEVTETEQK
jgi:hypothetical protein